MKNCSSICSESIISFAAEYIDFITTILSESHNKSIKSS